MKIKKIITSSILASAIALSINQANADVNKDELEKCYGVVKAGMNDCKSGEHSCAAQAIKDGDATEFVLTPKGLCDKLVNGKTGS
jgi:uncharacterized membrane protein